MRREDDHQKMMSVKTILTLSAGNATFYANSLSFVQWLGFFSHPEPSRNFD